MKLFYKIKYYNDRAFFFVCRFIDIGMYLALTCSVILLICNHQLHLSNKAAFDNLCMLLIMSCMIDVGKTLEKNKTKKEAYDRTNS